MLQGRFEGVAGDWIELPAINDKRSAAYWFVYPAASALAAEGIADTGPDVSATPSEDTTAGDSVVWGDSAVWISAAAAATDHFAGAGFAAPADCAAV
ncbi:hypothetical protein [Tunturiibacter gelidiferens]|uniref:hypothetical protein n=1 Tax=Tunturiibacter gelidiferens TaxID=3069689 RepID=UPI003D9B814D